MKVIMWNDYKKSKLLIVLIVDDIDFFKVGFYMKVIGKSFLYVYYMK